jgi:tRNA A-37 threonylcarbamoyl transferase component Bud32
MNKYLISLTDIEWKYIYKGPDSFLDISSMDHLSGSLVKESSKRTVVHGSGIFAKEVRYQGGSALLKTVFGGTACKEGRIYLALEALGFRVPRVLGYGSRRSSLGFLKRDLLLTADVEGGIPLLHFISHAYAKLPPAEKHSLMRDFACFIRKLHFCGVSHGDFHAGNILVLNNSKGWEFVVLDTDRVRLRRRPFSTREQRVDLTLLYMSLGRLVSRSQRFRFLFDYGVRLDAEGRQFVRNIESEALKASARIWHAKAKRSLDTNSRFVEERQGGYRVLRVRSAETSGILNELLPYPDQLFEKGETLKNGRTVRAASISVEGKRYFFKRYNRKGWGYRIKNALRRSRAMRTWLVSWGFRVRDLSVPKPLLFLEKRHFRSLEGSYLVYEFIEGGRRLTDVWPEADGQIRKDILAQLGILLGRMHRCGCVHGDLKWNNILLRPIAGSYEIVLTDLDGSRILAGMNPRAVRKDLGRFLRDLDSMGDPPEVREFFLKCYETYSTQRFLTD